MPTVSKRFEGSTGRWFEHNRMSFQEYSIMRRLLGVMLLCLTLPAFAAPPVAAKYVEGTHYFRLKQPVRTKDPSRIEVVEVFWYGCPHCFHLDPLIKLWQKKLPADVDFHRSPALWNGPMAIHAQAFYAAQALGVLDKMHDPLFEALKVNREALSDVDQLAAFFAEHGVEEKAFRKAFASFVVQSNVKQADARARSYRIEGTPELIVNGKYRVSGRSAGGQDQMIPVVDFLIARERAERASLKSR
jgi:protein dithiol oxidoreductase (disulfide-forming)